MIFYITRKNSLYKNNSSATSKIKLYRHTQYFLFGRLISVATSVSTYVLVLSRGAESPHRMLLQNRFIVTFNVIFDKKLEQDVIKIKTKPIKIYKLRPTVRGSIYNLILEKENAETISLEGYFTWVQFYIWKV